MSKPIHISELLPPGSHVLHQVQKQCGQKGCGRVWVGHTFVPVAPGEPLPRRVVACDGCIAKIDRRRAAREALFEAPKVDSVPVDVDLTPPRYSPGYDYE